MGQRHCVYTVYAILYITVTLFRSLIHKFRLNLVVRCYRNSRHSQLFASLNYYREGGRGAADEINGNRPTLSLIDSSRLRREIILISRFVNHCWKTRLSNRSKRRRIECVSESFGMSIFEGSLSVFWIENTFGKYVR